MGLFDKIKEERDFQPNCELMDDGNYHCKPILREGDKVYNAEAVVAPMSGKFKILKFTGSAKVLPELEKHFRERKLE